MLNDQKFRKILLTFALALLFAMTAGSGAKAQEELRFTTSVPAQSFIYADILNVWAQRVSEDANGTIKIRTFPVGTLGRDPATHLDMVRDGIADIAYFVPGYTPGAINEATIMELPNSIPSSRVGSLAGTKMVEEGLWKGQGLEKVKILGMFSTAPTLLTTREKVEGLDDVQGLKLRGAGPTLLATIEAIGATPIGGITAPQIAEGISRGLLDGTVNEWVALTIFGIAETARYHLNVNLGASPLMVVINRDKYESLPKEARAAIDKHSGMAFAELWGKEFDDRIEAFRIKAKLDKSRTFSTLSDEEKARWDKRFQTVIDTWIKDTPNGQVLYDKFTKAVSELSK